MIGTKKIAENILDAVANLYAQYDALRKDVHDVREWVELIADDHKVSPDAVAERFGQKLKGHTGKMSSSELKRMVREATVEAQNDS